MRPFALALLAAGLLAGPAAADVITFTATGTGPTGSVQTYTVPTTGTYLLTAAGAQGGTGNPASGIGGLGAVLSGQVELTAGTVLSIAVGQAGGSQLENLFGNGGGGGGTFIVGPGDTPLLVAGGGGGVRGRDVGSGLNGGPGLAGPYGGEGGGAAKSSGLGVGGAVNSRTYGSGGAGFFGDGADDAPNSTGGKSWANGLLGGSGEAVGGFGGGGGASTGAGGGGGGYSGGNGGQFVAAQGGGGGSFFAAGFANTTATAGANAGNGFASIELIRAADVTPVPEPATLLTLGLLAGCGAAGWRRRKAG